MSDFKVIQPKKRTEEELIAEGFVHYPRRKQLVMARELTAAEAPKTIVTPWDTLIAEAGDMICYDPGVERKASLDEYEHWPVQRDLFDKTYAPWDEPDHETTPAEQHLRAAGCKPYYKSAGVWAKRIDEPHFVLTLESRGSVIIPAGAWVCIGEAGEPWSQDDDEFRSRYVVDEG